MSKVWTVVVVFTIFLLFCYFVVHVNAEDETEADPCGACVAQCLYDSRVSDMETKTYYDCLEICKSVCEPSELLREDE